MFRQEHESRTQGGTQPSLLLFVPLITLPPPELFVSVHEERACWGEGGAAADNGPAKSGRLNKTEMKCLREVSPNRRLGRGCEVRGAAHPAPGASRCPPVI